MTDDAIDDLLLKDLMQPMPDGPVKGPHGYDNRVCYCGGCRAAYDFTDLMGLDNCARCGFVIAFGLTEAHEEAEDFAVDEAEAAKYPLDPADSFVEPVADV